MKSRSISAFTLIELVLVVAIVGLLAAVVAPKLGSLRGDAEAVSEQAAVAAVRSGIKLAHMRNLARGSDVYPSALDSATAGPAGEGNLLFADVIEDGISDGNWIKTSDRKYSYKPSANQYSYDPATGWFGTGSPPARPVVDLGGGSGFGDSPFPDAGSGGSSESGSDTGGSAGTGDAGGTGEAPGDMPGGDLPAESGDAGEQGDGEAGGGLGGGEGGDNSTGLTREQVQSLTPEEILAASLTPEQFSWLTPEQLAAIDYRDFAYFTPEQIAAMTAEQITALNYDQFGMVLGYLTVAQTPWARPDQIAMLSKEEYAKLTKAHLAALTQEQLAERALADAVRTLTYGKFSTVEVDYIKYLTAAQVASIPDSYYLGKLSEEQRAALWSRQIQALNTNKTGIGLLNEEQRQFLTTGQIQSITYGQFRYVPVNRIAELTGAQVAAIPDSYEFGRLSDDQRYALTETQVQALNAGKTGIALLSTDQRTYLTTAQVQAVSYSQFRYLPVERVAELTTAQVATIPDSYEFGRLSDEQRYALTETQVQALNAGKTGIALLSADQRTCLTTAQVQAVSYSQFRYLPVERVAELTTAQVATIPDSYEFGRLSDQQRYALTETQVQALNAGKTGIALLSADQRTYLTAAQVQAVGYTQYRYLPVDKISELTTQQIAAIPDSYELGKLSTEQRAALTAAQVPALKVASTGISLLPAEQRTYLTSSQVRDLSYSQHSYLPTDKIQYLTAAQIASIPSSYEFGKWTTEQRAALSAGQVPSLDVTKVGIELLPAEQRTYLSTSQVQSLAYSKFSYLPSDKVSNLTDAQIASIPSSYYFNQLSSESVHALTQSQVLAISDSYYNSIKYRLTPEQLAWRP